MGGSARRPWVVERKAVARVSTNRGGGAVRSSGIGRTRKGQSRGGYGRSGDSGLHDCCGSSCSGAGTVGLDGWIECGFGERRCDKQKWRSPGVTKGQNGNGQSHWVVDHLPWAEEEAAREEAAKEEAAREEEAAAGGTKGRDRGVEKNQELVSVDKK